MKKAKMIISAVIATVVIFGVTSCSKEYAKYDNMEVVESTYDGNVEITSTGTDPAGDFTGDGNSGVYSFVWENSASKAQLNFDITTDSGSVQFVLKDAKGDEVLNETLTAEGDEDSFSGVSEEGKKGNWLVEITLTDFDGDGSFSINPGD